MAARISITVDDADVQGAFARLSAAGRNLRPAMDEIGSMLVASVIHRFETESGPDGVAWKPSIRARTFGGQTLTDSGRLRDSVTHRATADAVEVGTNVIYAAAHQFGATIAAKAGGRLGFRLPGGLGFRSPASVTLPARPFLGVDAGDRTEILAILRDHLEEAADAR